MLGGASQCDESSGLCDGGVTLRPCCVGLNAGCVLTSQENCSFQNGYWHTNAVRVLLYIAIYVDQTVNLFLLQSLCRDVNCLADVCDVAAFADSADSQENANQWYRFVTPVFLHAGGLAFMEMINGMQEFGLMFCRSHSCCTSADLPTVAGNRSGTTIWV